MTPFRNDESNPFALPSVWPKMPQTPMRVASLRREPSPQQPAAPDPVQVEVIAAAAEAEMAIPQPAPLEVPQPQPLPIAAPIGLRPARSARRELRLTPLVAAGAVGAGGMAALFLLLGVRPALTRAPAPAPARSTLAVGEMVGQPPAPPSAAEPAQPAPPPAAAAARPTPRLALALSAAPRAAARPAPRAAALVEAPPAAAEPAVIPPPKAVANLVVPAADPPPAPAPAAKPYTPPPAPDRNAPIATHVPD